MTETAISHQVVNHPVEDDADARHALNIHAYRAALRSLLKRRIITLYCFGLFNRQHTQYLIDRFRLWEA